MKIIIVGGNRFSSKPILPDVYIQIYQQIAIYTSNCIDPCRKPQYGKDLFDWSRTV